MALKIDAKLKKKSDLCLQKYHEKFGKYAQVEINE